MRFSGEILRRCASLSGVIVSGLLCLASAGDSIAEQKSAVAASVDSQQGVPTASNRAAQSHDVACPSSEFKVFLKAFANQGNVQAAYTAQPYKVKLPYYWVHSTAAGDPRYPRWDVQERRGAAEIGYRFDAQSNGYVFDSGKLAPDQQWKRSDHAELKPRNIGQFEIKRLSASRYEVAADGFVHSYVKRRSGCWYFEQSWSFEPLAYCKWPEQCKKWQE